MNNDILVTREAIRITSLVSKIVIHSDVPVKCRLWTIKFFFIYVE